MGFAVEKEMCLGMACVVGKRLSCHQHGHLLVYNIKGIVFNLPQKTQVLLLTGTKVTSNRTACVTGKSTME